MKWILPIYLVLGISAAHANNDLCGVDQGGNSMKREVQEGLVPKKYEMTVHEEFTGADAAYFITFLPPYEGIFDTIVVYNIVFNDYYVALYLNDCFQKSIMIKYKYMNMVLNMMKEQKKKNNIQDI